MLHLRDRGMNMKAMIMKTSSVSFLIVVGFLLLCSLNAFAGEKTFEGELSVKGTLADVKGNDAKFNEYRDVKDSVTGDLRLKYRDGLYYLDFDAAEIAAVNQEYMMTGGLRGKFGYGLFYDETPHNIAAGALSSYSGIGGSVLTGLPGGSTPFSFDYETRRKKFGGEVRLDLIKPFFLNISAQTEKKEGIKPGSGGGSVFGSFVELPEPVDTRTNTIHAEAGYSSKPYFASISYYLSNFENHIHGLEFTDPSTSSADSLTLPPDNRYYKIAFKGSVLLPLKSRLSLNAGESKTKSESPANSIVENLGYSSAAFNGKSVTRNYDIILTANPFNFLDGKIFTKYYDRKNESEGVDEDFGFRKNSYGIQLGFRLPANVRLTTAYTRSKTNYTDRDDAVDKVDHTYSADMSWSGSDIAAFRIGYEKLRRGHNDNLFSDPESIDVIVPEIRRFDVAPLDRNTFKASVDLFPLEGVSITLGYKYRKSDYTDTRFGLKNDRSNAFFADASYALKKSARFYGYFDYEMVKFYQTGHGISPDSINSETDWNIRREQKNYDYGLGTDIYVIPNRLTLKLGYDNMKSGGTANWTYVDIPTPEGLNIGNWGDYRKQAFSARAIYDVMKSLSVSAGYAYEKYKNNDPQYSGYPDYPYIFDSGFGTAYLAGLYKDINYKANVIFVSLTYRF